MVTRIDSAHQRYIPNKFLSKKEVVDNILKRIDVLDFEKINQKKQTIG